MNTENINVDERAEQAMAFFKSGYNCAQSVYMSYCDLFGMKRQTAARIIAPMGAGIGRMREVCGAATGMFMIAGLLIPADDPADREARTRNYAAVQHLAKKYKEENGSIICHELLGLNTKESSPVPDPRTNAYYKKRPCAELVKCAATIVGNAIVNHEI